jgi:hypothetical protein
MGLRRRDNASGWRTVDGQVIVTTRGTDFRASEVNSGAQIRSLLRPLPTYLAMAPSPGLSGNVGNYSVYRDTNSNPRSHRRTGERAQQAANAPSPTVSATTTSGAFHHRYGSGK